MATRGLGPCLFLYPESQWGKVLDRLERQKARVDPDQRRHYLQLMHHTAEASVDGQGRISLPPHLSKVAGIEAEVLFVGAGDVIEMWNPARYDEFVGAADEDFDAWRARFL